MLEVTCVYNVMFSLFRSHCFGIGDYQKCCLFSFGGGADKETSNFFKTVIKNYRMSLFINKN